MITLDPYLACQACKGTFEGGNDAAGWAILFMLLVIGSVLGAICLFIYRLNQRQKANVDTQFDDPFQHSKK